MEVIKVEIATPEMTAGQVREHGIQELLDVQLAFVGGGIGDVIVG